ncbi:MAG: hypothetical protein HYS08_08790 [Chlamydiae bacterium]|nr:hypothetical protein [Chlamydiota bacterium]MBI3265459.1 hypothetical protein [Chlamydiota bacterium]
MNNQSIEELFKRQAQWQKNRRLLSWAEKIHWVEKVRKTVLELKCKK